MAEGHSARPKWPAWVGWGLFALGALERIVGWGGSIDFVLARWNEPAWVGSLMGGILQYANLIGLGHRLINRIQILTEASLTSAR